MRVLVERCHTNVDTILHHNQVGCVQSVFQHSSNLILKDRMIHLGGEMEGALPFGVVIGRDALASLLSLLVVGDPIRWDENSQCLVFGSDIQLDFAAAQRFTTDLAPKDQMMKQVPEKLEILCTWLRQSPYTTGWEQDIGEAINCIMQGEDRTSPYVGIASALASSDEEVIQQTCLATLGRGLGLTPAGDDVLLGCLAALYVLGEQDRPFVAVLEQLLATRGEQLTTKVSLEYLYYAVRGQFGSKVNSFCCSLLYGSGEELVHDTMIMLETGHTSGLDTLLGVLLTMRGNFAH